jgi:glycyl-tRNA synthetase alpha subunit
MQPFLIAAPPLYLKSLRDMGFKTFNGFIDESYDLEFDDSKRLSMINQEIQRICSIPIETMKSHIKEIEHILIHNQIKLLTYDFEKAEVDVCKQILNEEYKADLL